jgi:hypothetical protein
VPGHLTWAPTIPTRVRTSVVAFQQSDIPIALHAYGSKPVVLHGGVPMFAEIALVRLCKEAGWKDARWFQSYSMTKAGPKVYADWDPAVEGSKQSYGTVADLRDTRAGDLVESIANKRRKRGLRPYSGCWDVIAWTDDDILIYEAKQRKGSEPIKESQAEWMKVARSRGIRVPLNRFVVAEFHLV